MRRRGQIYQQYKQLKFRARKSWLREALKQRPCNCQFNQEFEVDYPPQRVGVCMLRTSDPNWSRHLCSDHSEADREFASTCPGYAPNQDAEEIKDEFSTLIDEAESTGNLGYLAYRYPDLAALLWVLCPWEDSDDGESEEEPPLPTPIKIGKEAKAVLDLPDPELEPSEEVEPKPETKIASNPFDLCQKLTLPSGRGCSRSGEIYCLPVFDAPAEVVKNVVCHRGDGGEASPIKDVKFFYDNLLFAMVAYLYLSKRAGVVV